jgi:hypothetical protein
MNSVFDRRCSDAAPRRLLKMRRCESSASPNSDLLSSALTATWNADSFGDSMGTGTVSPSNPIASVYRSTVSMAVYTYGEQTTFSQKFIRLCGLFWRQSWDEDWAFNNPSGPPRCRTALRISAARRPPLARADPIPEPPELPPVAQMVLPIMLTLRSLGVALPLSASPDPIPFGRFRIRCYISAQHDRETPGIAFDFLIVPDRDCEHMLRFQSFG